MGACNTKPDASTQLIKKKQEELIILKRGMIRLIKNQNDQLDELAKTVRMTDVTEVKRFDDIVVSMLKALEKQVDEVHKLKRELENEEDKKSGLFTEMLDLKRQMDLSIDKTKEYVSI